MPPFGDAFDPRRDVNAVAKDIVALDDDIADVDPNAEAERINFEVGNFVLTTFAGFQRRKRRRRRRSRTPPARRDP